MNISVRRTGGFAGLTEELGTVDTEHLDSTLAQQIEEKIRSLNFFALPATVAGDSVGADMYRYEITVREGDHTHTVAFQDDGSPQTAPLRQLVDTISGMV